MKTPFVLSTCDPQCSKRPLRPEIHSGGCAGHPLPPQASASDRPPGAWECHWWMTAALAPAAAAATMASGSSGLTAARLLSCSFLCESGRDSLLQTPRAPGLAGPCGLVQATAGPSGAGPWRGPGAARVWPQIRDLLGSGELCWMWGLEA